MTFTANDINQHVQGTTKKMKFEPTTDYVLDGVALQKLADLASRFNDGMKLTPDERRNLAQAMQHTLGEAIPLPPSGGSSPDSGHMTPERYRHLLEALDASQGWAAEFFAVDDRRARRWAEGKAPIPRANAMLLEVMNNYRLDPEDVEILLK